MELTLQASFIELLSPVNGGSVLAMALTIEKEFSYECVYWLHPNGNKLLVIDDKFLKLFGVEETSMLPKEIYEACLAEIEASLPDKEEIFSNYNYTNKDQ